MIGSANTELNQVGGLGGYSGFGGFGGGMGGFGLFGLFGLLNNRRGGLLGGDDCGDGVGGAALLAAIASAKDQTVSEGRALASAICDSEKTNLQQFYAAAIQAANNTQAIKDQATSYQVVNDAKFDALTLAGVNQTAAILARINQTETDRLRDELELSRHAVRAKDVEIQIQNTNNATAIAMQQQQQQQRQAEFDIHRRFDSLFSQVAKSSQDIINVGGLIAGATQTANPVNVKS